MKQRNGFVSNSSSSSFVISRSKLTDEQVYKIENHIEYWNRVVEVVPGSCAAREEDAWDIRVNEEAVGGYAFMDNFSMVKFLKHIGVNEYDIEWDGHLL